MNTEQLNNTAHSLYTLYEALPGDVQETFLKELIQNKLSEIKKIAFSDLTINSNKKAIIYGVMDNQFKIPNNFDDPLPENVIDDFYTEKL